MYESGYDSGKEDGAKFEHRKMLVNNVETVMQNLQVDLADACQILAVSVADYQTAKVKITLP